MKNIYEILKSIGVEIPEDKKEEFDKAVNENYKTIKEFEGTKEKLVTAETEKKTLQEQYDTDIKKRDDDLKALQTQLENSGVDKTTLETLQGEIKRLQDENTTNKEAYEKKLSAQSYEFAVKEKVNELKFSSNSAKKAFTSDLLANPLQVKDGKLLGFDDFVNAYKEQDAGAFIADEGDNGGEGGTPGTPRISAKSGKGEEGNPNPAPEAPKPRTVIW